MKRTKSTVILYVTAILFLITAPAAFAGHGMGAMDGSGPIMNITDGTPVTIDGMVTAIGTAGAGMTIDTGDELITVYGIGPVMFWNAAGIARPTVGEEVSVNGYEVTLSDGSTRIIATDITVGDDTITLRDADTGTPLWRGGCQNCNGGMNGQGNRLRDGSCLNQ